MSNESKDGSWKETNHGRTMSLAIESLVKDGFFEGKDILELGGGIANHTVRMLQGNPKSMITTEISAERLEVTRNRVLEESDQSKLIRYQVADWLEIEGTFDMVVTNPPYFMSGKRNRRYFIDELILNAHKRLVPQGYLLFIQSSMAGIDKTYEIMKDNGFTTKIIMQSSFEWRDYYFEDEDFIESCDAKPSTFFIQNGKRMETLFVVLGSHEFFESSFTH